MTSGASSAEIDQLRRLAGHYGVQTSYVDVEGRRQDASPEALLAVLRALGAPVNGLADVPRAARERAVEAWTRWCEPVLVAWDGQVQPVDLWLPEPIMTGPLECVLHLEDGQQLFWAWDLAEVPALDTRTVDGSTSVHTELVLPWNLPMGYHHLSFIQANESASALIIAAPERAYPGPEGKAWGVFLPLYALRTTQSWGTGNLSDLEQLLGWVKGLGGEMVGTLPMLAAYLDQPFEPSPYAPVSRLFWNEFFLDITRIPELEQCQSARDVISSREFQAELVTLRGASLVDYRRGMAVRRRVLNELASCLVSSGSARATALEDWAEWNPRARDYARFRAAVETRGETWMDWPERMRQGTLHADDVHPEKERYHLYVQWLAREQLQTLAGRARQGGTGLYLDFPLGVHGQGYDVWRERDMFAAGVSVGAPPDPLYDRGQNWGFPPMHPEEIRRDGYRYYIECLRNHLRNAGTLRVDHVMGMHRLYWIPPGMSPLDGVYVNYQPEEFYAILSLESHRNQAAIVGEDLGTVQDEVRAEMRRHNLYRMCVLPFSLNRNDGEPEVDVPSNSLAVLNTHDMPPFAAYWNAMNGEQRAMLLDVLRREGWLGPDDRETGQVTKASLDYLAASDAKLVFANLEDFWLETESQNVPGTVDQHPNWRRKARYRLEEFTRKPEIVGILNDMDRLRKEERNKE